MRLLWPHHTDQTNYDCSVILHGRHAAISCQNGYSRHACVMLAKLPCAVAAAVMAMNLCYAAAGGLMATASLASPHVRRLPVLAGALRRVHTSCHQWACRTFGNMLPSCS